MKTGHGIGSAWAALVLGTAAVAAAQPLDRTPASYHILARESAHLKDYDLHTGGGACNIGVNNAGGMLGTNLNGSSVFTMDGGQVVADDCSSAGGAVVQCFCNGPANFNVACAPWATPILADETDATFIAACNDAMALGDYPAAFVFGAQDVSCAKDTDCVPLAVDAQPGNGKCDLMPGTYRLVNPQADCTIVLGGQYDVADYAAGKRVRLEVAAPTTLNVAGETDQLGFGDGGELDAECGDLRVNYRGPVAKPKDRIVNLGRANKGRYTMDLCAPFALLRMRNKNMLRGHFFANAVQSDFNNEGECCDGGGRCGCFDTVTPATVAVGAQLTLAGGCDLDNVVAVRVCGTVCPIMLPRTPAQIVCTVAAPTMGQCSVCGLPCTVAADCPGVGETCNPVPLPRPCDVDAVTANGFYRSATQVTVTP